MPDLAHFYGNDINVAANGDLLTADGDGLTTQRVLRRLLTNPGDYLWHPEYGAGLPSYIGRAVPTSTIVGVIRSQLFQEPGVARSPDPQISVKPIPSGYAINIKLWGASSGAPQLLSFDLTP